MFFPQLGLKSIQTASLNFRSIKVSSITFSQQQRMFHPKGDAKDLGNQFGNIKTTGRDGKIWGNMMEYYSIPSGKHTYIAIENGY